MIALCTALAYTAFAALCLAMPRHHEQVFGRHSVPARRRYALTGLGWMLLAASALSVIHTQGWGLGLILWTGILTATALPLSLLLTYAPRLALVLAAAPLPVGLMLLLVPR